jgi:hypothetical protein
MGCSTHETKVYNILVEMTATKVIPYETLGQMGNNIEMNLMVICDRM